MNPKTGDVEWKGMKTGDFSVLLGGMRRFLVELSRCGGFSRRDCSRIQPLGSDQPGGRRFLLPGWILDPSPPHTDFQKCSGLPGTGPWILTANTPGMRGDFTRRRCEASGAFELEARWAGWEVEEESERKLVRIPDTKRGCQSSRRRWCFCGAGWRRRRGFSALHRGSEWIYSAWLNMVLKMLFMCYYLNFVLICIHRGLPSQPPTATVELAELR